MSAELPRAQEPTIWIAVHDLSRTGVPVLLTRLLRAVSATQRAQVHVVAIFGGPLLSELTPLCASVTVLEPMDRRSAHAVASLGLLTLGMGRSGELVRNTAWRAKLARQKNPDVVLVHGAGAWPVVEVVGSDVPVVVHLHELGTALDRSIPVQNQAAAFQRAQQVMVVSEPVGQLAQHRGADLKKIVMMPGCVQLPSSAPPDSVGPDPVGPDLVEADPAGPDLVQPGAVGEQWVLGAGTPGWRKGTDRLAAVAHELRRDQSAARVGWVGGKPSGSDATAIGRFDPVTWFEEQADPWPLLSCADVFVVPSREDPLPLVALEAGAYRRAVVAMPTGGLPQLLADGRGLVGGTQSLRWFVGAVQQVLDSPAMAEEMGERLHEYVQAHHDVAVLAPAWFQALVHVASR
ncbi:unannotated protein [freshwater metagenome]|uniref:Unannotated protein n=1 Tax=freshwater metagenome TaxID=449393 RepID=A0A6J6AUR4_9ZZZZ|nr:glycosyltransferase [Actinomycetota bacterium]MTA63001.1 glycosyltransferase [Actinomycetota bacterium]